MEMSNHNVITPSLYEQASTHNGGMNCDTARCNSEQNKDRNGHEKKTIFYINTKERLTEEQGQRHNLR